MSDLSNVVPPNAPEGKTSIDEKMFFEPERLSYESADAIAKDISETIGDEVDGRIIVIVDTAILSDFANLQSAYLNLQDIAAEYRIVAASTASVTPSPPSPTIRSAIAPQSLPIVAAAATALGFVGLFRSDVEYHGAKTSVDELAFQLALANRLRTAGATKVYVPALTVFTAAQTPNSLHALSAEAQDSKEAAWKGASPLITALVELESKLDQAVIAKDQQAIDVLTKQITAARRNIEPISSALARADRRLSDMQTQWNAADPQSGMTLLSRLLRAESLQLSEGKYLHAAVVSSGGHHKLSRNLWRTVFAGDGLSFMGGATVRWALLEKDGAIERSGIRTVRVGSKFPSLFGEFQKEIERMQTE